MIKKHYIFRMYFNVFHKLLEQQIWFIWHLSWYNIFISYTFGLWYISLITMIQDLNIYDIMNPWIKIVFVNLAAFTSVKILYKFFANWSHLSTATNVFTRFSLLAGTFMHFPSLTTFTITLCIHILYMCIRSHVHYLYLYTYAICTFFYASTHVFVSIIIIINIVI